MNAQSDATSRSLGARLDAHSESVSFAVHSENASRIELWIYAGPREPMPIERVVLTREEGGDWSTTVSVPTLRAEGAREAIYYGYRAWGPNWPFDPAWAPGARAGFLADVDDGGHRFNPNKLLVDPYTNEISHDPEPRLSLRLDPNEYVDDYDSGEDARAIDTGPVAPKSLIPLSPVAESTGTKPARSLQDDIVYEAHVRSLTKLDTSLPEDCRGTYRGAGTKAAYLRDLGITAIELLPVFHFASEQNDDDDPRGDNDWGYMTLGYFAPNRRYSSDRSPGGPTREFKAMVRAFHEQDIKVILDVVFNHTGEGMLKRLTETVDSRQNDALQDPSRACLLSFRGLDNALYYTLRDGGGVDQDRPNRRYQDNSACGPSLNVVRAPVAELVIASLRYWAEEMGVDGFRFDLAPVLGNRLERGGFEFDKGLLLSRISRELPVRDPTTGVGVDLIAEPWATGVGQTYQLGKFPDGWAEWNDEYRKTVRRSMSRTPGLAPWQLANVLAGSDEQFRKQSDRSDPRPWNSINYVASHDGFTLRDIVSNTKLDDACWDHDHHADDQRQAARNAVALLMTSAGTPMLLFGDELWRTQDGRDNTVAVDDRSVYLRWDVLQPYLQARAVGGESAEDFLQRTKPARRVEVHMFEFVRAMARLRATYRSLRPSHYFTGQPYPGSNLADIAWYGADGGPPNWSSTEVGFLAYRVDTTADLAQTGTRSIFVAYRWADEPTTMVLPTTAGRWWRFADTAGWLEDRHNLDAPMTPIDSSYLVHPRSVVVFIEKAPGA